MLKLTQPHLSMNNMFPPINAHSRPPSEDLRGVANGGAADIHSASKHQQLRRQQQQTTDHHRRSPLRSNSLITGTRNRFVKAAAAAAVQISPSLTRSSSFAHNGILMNNESAKIIYRSNEYGWNDHSNNSNIPNQPLRAASPMKSKLSTSARHITNGVLHDGTANSMLHLPSTTSPMGHHSSMKDDTNNGDIHLLSAARSRHASRLQRTSSHLDKNPVTNAYGMPIRSESYRSSRLDYNLRPRHTSSNQRQYATSKTSFNDATNGGEQPFNGGLDENNNYQQQMNIVSNTQRMHGSPYDVNRNRKLFPTAKSNTFHVPPTVTSGHYSYLNPNQEIHRSETTIDRNNATRFGTRGTASKENIITTSKYRQGLNASVTTTPAAGTVITTTTTTSNTPIVIVPGERHPSAQSYKSRDPNISYAYTDVKKYIEENELMTPEKEQSIRNWIIDVEKYRNQLQNIE